MKQSLSNLKLKLSGIESFRQRHSSTTTPMLSEESPRKVNNLSISVQSPVPPRRPVLPLLGEHDEYNLPSPLASPPAYNCQNTLNAYGYECTSSIAKTLQGEIFKAKTCRNDRQNVVIKVTDKVMHSRSIAIVDGKEIFIKENIVNEIRILKWLTRHHPPAYMTRFVEFFQDSKNIFLVMEDGGMDFFKFVSECHKLINNKSLSINEWQCAIKVLFKQMVAFIDWLHNTMNVCHLDLSLENLLINNVFVMSDHSGKGGKKQIYFSHNFYIKFCDFGLAEAFDGKDFRCNKYVGKTGYKSPKVYGKKEVFDARCADVWSLGIVLFMCCIGAPPFKRPSKKEGGYNMIISGKLDELLMSWGRMNYLSADMFDLLSNMLVKDDNKRLTIKQVKNHPWLQ